MAKSITDIKDFVNQHALDGYTLMSTATTTDDLKDYREYKRDVSFAERPHLGLRVPALVKDCPSVANKGASVEVNCLTDESQDELLRRLPFGTEFRVTPDGDGIRLTASKRGSGEHAWAVIDGVSITGRIEPAKAQPASKQ
ncbi:MAG: hypothetical protein MR874_01580 [Coriobacteriaceae bacterium]|uniref:hypothetical protein n=1 Tax=Tractidigestivibacter sp. TaxID=2847320 RepID=UPI002A832A01|nr:hypothetical protein [Tractidigestivibacter sp.]MCI6274794.1 hypothetical protein [Coriobacteriaceae bacterium]MCI6547592.1 hypothetical protein [Coriobacteriaceae bacterium]MCI6843440.1 hypothetical protein [Coriobacteriaceae bacterium]MCI7438441.1 hypothetical protein [Coriobacteriaceae bacterium]MDD7583982.1 hypothetical protein [Coriobacteriaceae bacterium]